MTADDTAGLDEPLLGWVRTVTGASRVTVKRRSAGGSRAGYAIDAHMPDGTALALWLRIDTGAGPQSGTVYTLRREAAVYRALAGRGVKIASVIAVHPDRDAFLMQRLVGDNWFSQIDDPAHATAIATQFMEQLATLHRIDVRSLDLPEVGRVRPLHEHVLDEIAIWEEQYRDQDEPEPLIELALRWLRAHLPEDGAWPVVLVQGDTGPGNFMYDGDGLVAVTDWEMAHYGDLHDDLAWIYARDLQERFTNLPARLRDYERLSGHTVDRARLRYFLVLAQLRCAIGTRNGVLARDSRGEIANHLVYSALHMRALAEALAGAAGVTVPAPDDHSGADAPVDPAATTDVTWMYDVALDDLRHHVVPAIGDGFAERRAKGLARLLKFLRERDRIGPLIDRAELALLGDLLGQEVTDLASGRRALCDAIRSRTVAEREAIAFAVRQQQLRTEVMRPAMGVLADRHHAPLP